MVQLNCQDTGRERTLAEVEGKEGTIQVGPECVWGGSMLLQSNYLTSFSNIQLLFFYLDALSSEDFLSLEMR